jgi:hypothetical protein
MSSANNEIVLNREELKSEFRDIMSETFDKKSHKKRIGCGHIRGLIKQIRGDNNTLEGALCDIIDNVDGIATNDKLSNIGCWVEMLYDDENGKIHQIKITDNLPRGFNGLENEGTDHPLNMTHMRVGHVNDNESSEFGTGLKKALVYIGNSCEIYTRSIENKKDVCRYVKLDFVEMSQRKNAEDSYELTAIEEISYEKYRQYHDKEFGSTIIISNIRDNSICSYTDKQVFERKIRDYLSLKFSERFIVKSFSLYLNNEQIEQQPDVYLNNDNKFTWKFYIPIVNNSINGNDIVVYKIKHGGLNKKLRFGMISKKDKKGKTSEQFGFVEDKKINFDIYKNSPDYHELIFDSCSTSKTEFDNIRSDNEVDIIRMRNHGQLSFYKQKGDGYSNYISNRIKYDSKKLNTFLGVSSFKVASLKENVLTSALRCAQMETTKHFAAQRRKECKDNNSNSNSNSDDDDSSVISGVSSITNNSIGSKTNKSSKNTIAVISKKVTLPFVMPPQPPIINDDSSDDKINDDDSSDDEVVEVVEYIKLGGGTSSVDVLSGFGKSVSISATDRMNLSVKDGLEIMSQMLQKEDFNINIDSLLKMYLDDANSKSKLRILVQLVNEKYSPEDLNKHMLGGADLVRLSNSTF